MSMTNEKEPDVDFIHLVLLDKMAEIAEHVLVLYVEARC